MRASILLSVQRQFGLQTRLLIVLFALIQIIAPTWHVCEMGASSCCPPQGEGQLLHCPAPGTASAESADCEHGPPDEKQLNATPEHGAESCLAKLLMGMPWQGVAAVELPKPITERVALVSSPLHCVSLAAVAQPPSRGPPAFS